MAGLISTLVCVRPASGHTVTGSSCKNCPSSYTGQIGRKFSPRIKQHKKSGFRHSWYTDRASSPEQGKAVSAITDHAVQENHVINWNKAHMVNRETQQQTRWIKEALQIRKICMNQDAGAYQLSHTWHQVISR